MPRVRRAAPALLALWTCAAGASPEAAPAPPPAHAGVPIRLMVLHEVTSRYAKVGDRFALRVDAPAEVDGVAVPVGATAWGEVTSVASTQALGKSGRIAARLVRIDLPGGALPLSGDADTKGRENTAGVLIGAAAWGPFALLNKGTNGKLKAGEIIVGYAGGAAPPAPSAPAAAKP